MKSIHFFQAIFLLIGAATLCGALALGLHTRRFVAHAARADGLVTALQRVERNPGDPAPTYAPVVQYTAANGEPAQFTSSTSSSPPVYRVGERVQVLYLPEQPGAARIDAWFSLWGGPTIMGGLGGVCFAIGAAMFLLPRGAARLRN